MKTYFYQHKIQIVYFFLLYYLISNIFFLHMFTVVIAYYMLHINIVKCIKIHALVTNLLITITFFLELIFSLNLARIWSSSCNLKLNSSLLSIRRFISSAKNESGVHKSLFSFILSLICLINKNGT